MSENDLHTVEAFVQLSYITFDIQDVVDDATMGGPVRAQGMAFVVAFYPGACPSMTRSNTIQKAHLAATPGSSGRDAVRRRPSAPSVHRRTSSPWRYAGFAP